MTANRDSVRAMLKRTRAQPQKPRYEAAPCLPRDDAAWMIYDARDQRVVVTLMHRETAYTLARTMNVADLSVPAKDYGGDP
jgi:hypothetical protein